MITAPSSVKTLPASNTGWLGVDLVKRAMPLWLMAAWENRTIVHRMVHELDFIQVPYEHQ